MFAATPHQLSLLAERAALNAVAGIQRQRDADRRFTDRRIQQLEQKVEGYSEERAREVDARKRWAEVQGSIVGLIEEHQVLSRRLDGFEERLARTGGLELVRQRSLELEQQVQALEQHCRLSDASQEEVHKRQSVKLCRADHLLEELGRRLAKAEERLSSLPAELAGHSHHQLGLVSSQAAGVGVAQRHLEDQICELNEQISCIVQQSSCSEAALNKMQQQVADVMARLLDAEGNIDHALHSREKHWELNDSVLSEGAERVPQMQDLSLATPNSHHNQQGNCARQLAQVMQELSQVRSWLAALDQGSHGSRVLHNHDDGRSSEATPRSYEPLRDQDMASTLRLPVDDLPRQHHSQQLSKGSEQSLDDLSMISSRLAKLEESTDLYLSYTKCVASDQADQIEKLAMRLQDMESSHKVASSFWDGLQAQPHLLELLDGQDLGEMDVALQKMQVTCLQAADDIAAAVKWEMQALQDGLPEKAHLEGTLLHPGEAGAGLPRSPSSSEHEPVIEDHGYLDGSRCSK